MIWEYETRLYVLKILLNQGKLVDMGNDWLLIVMNQLTVLITCAVTMTARLDSFPAAFELVNSDKAVARIFVTSLGDKVYQAPYDQGVVS